MLCVGSVALLVVALSTERWVTGRILCKTGAEIVNASHPELEQFIGDLYYGLFQGGKTKKCGLGRRRSKIHSKVQHSSVALWPVMFNKHILLVACISSTAILSLIYLSTST